MRRLLTVLAAALPLAGFAVAVPGSASAAVVLAHDFESGSTAGWRFTGGWWGISTDGTRVLRQSRTGTASARAAAGDAGWSGYTLSARVRPTSLSGPSSAAGVVVRASGEEGYALVVRPSDRLELVRHLAGGRTVLASATLPVRAGRWYDLALRAEGDLLTGTATGPAGTATLTATDATFAAGAVALTTERAAVSFDDVLVDTIPPPRDTRPPSAPGRPEVLEVTPTTATITWPAATDDVGVTGYMVYFGGQFYEDGFLRQVATNGPVTLPIAGNTGASYHFSVRAVDAAGNMSTLGPRVYFPNPPTVPRVPGDTTPPTPPGAPVSSGPGVVSWTPATDDSGIVEYHVVHAFNVDEVRVRAKVPGDVTTAAVSPATLPNTVWVIAYDAAWNASRSPAVPLSPVTPPPTPPPAGG